MRTISIMMSCLFAFAFAGCDTPTKPMWNNPTPGHGPVVSQPQQQPQPPTNGSEPGGRQQPQPLPHLATGAGPALPAPRSY